MKDAREAADYFYLDPFTGAISIKQTLAQSKVNDTYVVSPLVLLYASKSLQQHAAENKEYFVVIIVQAYIL